MNNWRDLTNQKRFTEAEPLLEEHYAKDSQYGEHVVDRAWFYEEWGDEEKRKDVKHARELYEKSLESYQMFASWATSGGEGLVRMADVNRVKKKMKGLNMTRRTKHKKK